MFNFLGFRKDSKKSLADKEADGGFVIIGETVEEQRRKMQTITIAQPSTNVIVQSSKSKCPSSALSFDTRPSSALPHPGPVVGPPAADMVSAIPDLLGDIPFTLSPHVLAMQAGFPIIPDVLLSRDINYNLSNFQYDFTLENSVLHNI